MKASQFPFLLLQNWPMTVTMPAQAQIDLYNSIPNASGTMDYLTDFLLCDFPGYAPVVYPFTNIIPDPAGGDSEVLINTLQWAQSGTGPGSVPQANGYVASDPSGFVLWYQPFGGYVFVNNGDFLQFDLQIESGYDYP